MGCRVEHGATIKLLLEKAVDVDYKTNSGRTPLLWAIERGRKVVVKLLIEKATEMDPIDSGFSRTLLSWAAGSGHEAMVKPLFEEAAGVDSKNGRTLLSWALTRI
jgi:ankyrin repeat protein